MPAQRRKCGSTASLSRWRRSGASMSRPSPSSPASSPPPASRRSPTTTTRPSTILTNRKMMECPSCPMRRCPPAPSAAIRASTRPIRQRPAWRHRHRARLRASACSGRPRGRCSMSRMASNCLNSACWPSPSGAAPCPNMRPSTLRTWRASSRPSWPISASRAISSMSARVPWSRCSNSNRHPASSRAASSPWPTTLPVR